VDAETIYAVPTSIADPERTAADLCRALDDCKGKDRETLVARLQSRRAFVYVRRQVSLDQARRVAALKIKGIGSIKESRRYYPHRELAAALLGYVGLDNSGLGGIEATYDSLIKGHEGTVLVQADAHGTPFSREERPATTGATLELTIDHYLQYIAERELKAGVEWSGAASGAAVVMDPFTGEVLALASYPSFNPNVYRDYDEKARRNRAIQDLYEPGSTFKIVTASAALQEKVVRPDELIDTGNGRITFGSRVINDDHHYGVLTFEDVIVKSSNVGAIKVALRLGPDRMVDYVRRFGFGRPLSPDFRSESSGIVWKASNLSSSALASVAMGYQVGVTPLQMATAASTVANGGELIQPRVVRAVVKDGVRTMVPRKTLGRAIQPEIARTLTGIMENVVVRGTATRAQIDGQTIAGKTGTAKKLVNGRYRGHNDYNVSFVGFVPSRKPKYTIIVVVDSPHAVSPYGGVVAAPIFQKIAQAALRHGGVAPSVNPDPPVLVADASQIQGRPTAGPTAPPTVLPLGGQPGTRSAVPDLTGMSLRDAVVTLARLGFTAETHGQGLVVDQRPAPGSPIDTTVNASLWLSRQPVASRP
jgi:cell division protein FtsI (penicillin-binding protein 3)